MYTCKPMDLRDALFITESGLATVRASGMYIRV